MSWRSRMSSFLAAALFTRWYILLRVALRTILGGSWNLLLALSHWCSSLDYRGRVLRVASILRSSINYCRIFLFRILHGWVRVLEHSTSIPLRAVPLGRLGARVLSILLLLVAKLDWVAWRELLLLLHLILRWLVAASFSMFRYQIHWLTRCRRWGRRHLDWGSLIVGRRKVLPGGWTISLIWGLRNVLLILKHY